MCPRSAGRHCAASAFAAAEKPPARSTASQYGPRSQGQTVPLWYAASRCIMSPLKRPRYRGSSGASVRRPSGVSRRARQTSTTACPRSHARGASGRLTAKSWLGRTSAMGTQAPWSSGRRQSYKPSPSGRTNAAVKDCATRSAFARSSPASSGSSAASSAATARSPLHQRALISTHLPCLGVKATPSRKASIHVSCVLASPAYTSPSCGSTPMPKRVPRS
mmetsp:Transcript_104318/g.336364  ORF Transcript_104318/g.336364 Transcript_104318/m.336364 type:complete len:220 (+) Transcript_104318:120-779(+)